MYTGHLLRVKRYRNVLKSFGERVTAVTSGQNNVNAIKKNPGLPEDSIENKRALI